MLLNAAPLLRSCPAVAVAVVLVAAAAMAGVHAQTAGDHAHADRAAGIAMGVPSVGQAYAATATAAAPEPANQAEPRTVEIGALLPLTLNGEPFVLGEQWAVAVNASVPDFNAYLQGAGASWRLSVDLRDTQGLPSTALREARDMHRNDGINFIVGPSFSSNVGTIITDYIDPGDVSDLALVSQASTSPQWALDDNVYRLAIADDKQGRVIAGHLYQDGKRVMVPVWADDPFGNGLVRTTVERFQELGGVADYSADAASGGTVRSYERCSETYTTCIEDQFPAMARELADTVTGYIKAHGSDRVAVVYVGFELSDFVREAAAQHPILRTVQWVGSDADVLESRLVDGSAVNDFLVDTNFRAHTFSGSADTARYASLTDTLMEAYPGESNFSVYPYSSYDAVWAVGLAIEAAGGPGSSFGDIVAQIRPAVDGNDEGALGDVTLNEFGDIDSGDYAVWGIEPTGWERMGTYSPDGRFAMTYDDPIEVRSIGALLTLGPVGVSFLDDEFAVIAALAELDYNRDNPSGPHIDIRTIDTSLNPLPALNALEYGKYDYYYYPILLQMIRDAMAAHDRDGSFDSITGSFDSYPYTFGLGGDGSIVFHGLDSMFVGLDGFSLISNTDRTLEDLFLFLGPNPPPHMWVSYDVIRSVDPLVADPSRALVMFHAPSTTIIVAVYPPIVDTDGAHKPLLEAVIDGAVDTVASNSNDPASLAGTYDPASSPFYPFVLDMSGNIVADGHPVSASIAPANIADLPDASATPQEIDAALQADGDTVWLHYTYYNPATGLEEPKRSLLKQVTLADGRVYAFAAGYYADPDPVRSFLGPTTSQNVEAIRDRVNADGSGYVVVSPSSDSGSLAADDNIFRMAPPVSSQIPSLVNLMKAEGKSRLVIVPSDDVWARDLTALLTGEGSFEGYDSLAPISIINPAGVDYAGVAGQLESRVSDAIAASGGDAGSVGVLHLLFSRQAVPLFNALDSLDRSASPVFAVDHYGTDGIIDDSHFIADATAAGVASELGLIGPIFMVPPNPVKDSLSARLAAVGIVDNPYDSSMYDSVFVLGAAVASATDQYSVRDILADSPNVPGHAGLFPYRGALNSDRGITLDPAGDLIVSPLYYQAFTVAPSGTGEGYAWQRVVPGTVSGTVYADINNNAAMDAGEPGIAGVAVALVDGAGTTSSAVTAADGTYAFAGAAPGPVLVQAAPLPPLHKPSDGSSSYLYGVLPPVRSLAADFALLPVTPSSTATVTGKVYADANGNTVFDGQDAGLAGVPVFVVDFLTLTQSTAVTGAAGDYAVAGVLPDSVLVQIAPVPAGFLPAAGQETHRYATLAEGAATAVDFALSPVPPQDTASVAGTVYQDNNGNGVRDAGEPGIPDSLVFVFELLTAQQQTAFTDGNGMYSFSGVIPDTVLVQHMPKHGSITPTSPAGGFTYLDLGAGQSAAADFANSGTLASPVDTLRAAAFSETRIDLVWEAPSVPPASGGGADDRITGYRIEAESPPGTGFEPVALDTGTDLTWFYHTGLEPGTEYSYRVMPITGAGTSSASNVATAATDPAR